MLSSPVVITLFYAYTTSRPHISPSKCDFMTVFSAGFSWSRTSLNSKIDPFRSPTRRFPLKKSIERGKEDEMSTNFSSLNAPFCAVIIQIRLSLPPEMSLPWVASIAVMPEACALMHLTA